MQNIEIKELLDAKFTHLSAEIQAQGTLLEEKMKHSSDYMGVKMDEMIEHQKRTNGRVVALEKEAVACKKHRTLAEIAPWYKKLPTYILIPVLFTLIGVGVDDHYTIKSLEKHTVSDSLFLDVQADWWMHTEAKSRAYESMTKGNYEAIRALNESQAKIDSFLIEKYRVRSLRGNTLPDF